jgi:hypothetical protein
MLTSVKREVGDDQSGFSIAADPQTATLLVRGWGFWAPDIARAFPVEVFAACREHAGLGNKSMDMCGLRPIREEGQHAFTQVMDTLPGLGIKRVTVATSSQLTKLQLLRLVGANALRGFVSFVEGPPIE